jgi:ABC-2 type transport system ATP-binding protein
VIVDTGPTTFGARPVTIGGMQTSPSFHPAVAAISVAGLTKRYGAHTAVEPLDLELPAGVVAGFVGPNGAGKTTTMAMLLGLVRPSGGTGTVLGAPITDPAAYLPRVGALIETPAFYPALSGVDNLRMFATVAGHPMSQIPQLLETVGLAGRGDDRYRRYSLGMKQRLGIAAALLGDPELLILDEPANGLDPEGVQEMRGLIGRLAGAGRTVLVSSHDLSELEQVCDWLVLIDHGRSLYQGPTRDLLDGANTALVVAARDPRQHKALRDLLAQHGLIVEVDEDDRLVVDLDGQGAADVAAAVNRAAFDAGMVLVELSPQRTTLEDRYLALVQGGAR